MPFLQLVSLRCDVNKMNSSNLAVVFGPTLMPAPADDVVAMIRDSSSVITVVHLMIDFADRLFPPT